MPEKTTQKRVLYRTVSGQENTRFMQDNEEERFKNVYSVSHPDYGNVYPEPDEDWSGTAYTPGPLSPEAQAARTGKKFKFIDVGSMNNPLFPVSHRRVTDRSVETPAVTKTKAVTDGKNPVVEVAPSIQKNQRPILNAVPKNPAVIQNDWIKGGFLDNPMVKQYLPEFSDRSWNLQKKNIRYMDASGEIKFRNMTQEEAPVYRNLNPKYNQDMEKVYTDIDQEERFVQYPDFDVAKLYDPNHSSLADSAHEKVMKGLRSLNTNPYYNRMFYDMSQKGGTYAWREQPFLSENIGAQFVPKEDKIEFKNITKMLPPNIEEELIHAAQK